MGPAQQAVMETESVAHSDVHQTKDEMSHSEPFRT